MKKVQVIMSSYNGEKFIKKQIDSILNQQNVEVSLLIRDDGSKDGTIEILRDYENRGLIKVIYGLISYIIPGWNLTRRAWPRRNRQLRPSTWRQSPPAPGP